MITIKDKKYYTAKEVSEKFSVSMSTIARWRRQGILIGVPINDRKFLFSETALAQLVGGSHAVRHIPN